MILQRSWSNFSNAANDDDDNDENNNYGGNDVWY
jgi:hypothetical protein